jgi:uncharacterized repeat protein (TIGR03803 family)
LGAFGSTFTIGVTMTAHTCLQNLGKIAMLFPMIVLYCCVSFAQDAETVLHTFATSQDGSIVAAVLPDDKGDLYGITSFGGVNGQGTFFKLAPSGKKHWNETQLYSFPPVSGNGTAPFPGQSLVADRAGNLYGVSDNDGNLSCYSQGYSQGCGTVWQLTHSSLGWKRTVIYSFLGEADGQSPASLAIDSVGNLYGVASSTSQSSLGSVFELSPNGGTWSFSTLYSFTGGADGGEPQSIALDHHGDIFGTTYDGGISNPNVCYDSYDNNSGCGVVFEISHDASGWQESVLYSFTGDGDGASPYGTVALDPHGNIFGIVGQGTATGSGVFEVSHNSGGWTESLPHTFGNVRPSTGVVADANGNIFGATQVGGNLNNCDEGCGTVFELSPASNGWIFNTIYTYVGAFDGNQPPNPPILDSKGNLFIASGSLLAGNYSQISLNIELEISPESGGRWGASVMHDFPSSSDGTYPRSSLFGDSAGNLYGTTEGGGAFGWGTIFELSSAGAGWKETILYSFTGTADGALPGAALSQDAAGNLYGTAEFGGNTSCSGGCGTVFRLSPNSDGKWTFSVLHGFVNAQDGDNPRSGVILDSAGNIYGTSMNGSIAGCFSGCGSVFKLTPSASGEWHFVRLYTFPGGTNGGVPSYGTLAMDPQGRLYGVVGEGGTGNGLVYQLSPFPETSLWKESVLYSFTQSESASVGTLRLDHAGNLYGTTNGGGTYNQGTVFELSQTGNVWTKAVIYSFTGGNDGGNMAGSVVFDSAGNLFGVSDTSAFELSPKNGTWQETTLYNFGLLTTIPANSLVVDPNDNLFGTIPPQNGLRFSNLVYELTP